MINSKCLIVISSIMHILMYMYAAPSHAVDETWPLHAQFHIVQAIFWILGLDLTAIIIGWKKTSCNESWVKWSLLTIFLTSHLGYFISMIIIPEGRPPELISHIGLGVPMVLFLIGMVLEFKNNSVNEPT